MESRSVAAISSASETKTGSRTGEGSGGSDGGVGGVGDGGGEGGGEGGVAAALCTLHHLLWSVCVPSALLVTIVLWGVLYPADKARGHQRNELNPASFEAHAINTLLLLLDGAANRLSVRAADFYLTLGWATAYVLYAWAQYAQSGFWPYFFLDLSSWAAVGWYSLLIALFAAVYAMAVGGSALKARCAGLAVDGAALVPAPQPPPGATLPSARDALLQAGP